MFESFFVAAADKLLNSDKKPEDGEQQAEGFSSYASYNSAGTLSEMVGRVFMLVVVLLLIAFFGQYLWNNYACKLLTVARPAKSVMEILALFIFLRLMFP